MNFMPIEFGNKVINIYGGPYFDRPHNMVGVKLAEEINLPCDIDLPIVDYSIPDVKQAQKALLATIKAISSGKEVYVGCWGGKGRTGLFMAILAKAAGISDPIGHVRSNYNPHAVETEEQITFVKNFPTLTLSCAFKALSFKEKALVSPQASKMS